LDGATLAAVFGRVEGSGDLEAEDFLDNVLDRGNSGTTSDDFDGLDVDLDFRLKLFKSFSDSLEGGGDEFFELLSGELDVEVLAFGDAVDVDTGFLVGTQDLSGLFDGVEESETSFGVVLDSDAVLGVELFGAVFPDLPVHVSGTEVSVVDLVVDLSFGGGEGGDVGAELGVAQVDEGDVFGLVVEVLLSENTIGKDV
jgi:hypothetical protein